MTETFDPTDFIETMLTRGWRWCESDVNLLVNPDDHSLCVRRDPVTGQLSVSPRLEECLRLVIPTPTSKGRFWR